MNDGLIEHERKTIREIFSQFPEVKEAVLFGSRAKETAKPGSDLDFALKGEQIVLRTLIRISSAMEESILPYEVNLLHFQSVASKELRQQIENHGILFYSADQAAIGETVK